MTLIVATDSCIIVYSTDNHYSLQLSHQLIKTNIEADPGKPIILWVSGLCRGHNYILSVKKTPSYEHQGNT